MRGRKGERRGRIRLYATPKWGSMAFRQALRLSGRRIRRSPFPRRPGSFLDFGALGRAAPCRGTKGTCFRRNDRFARRKLARHATAQNNPAMTAAAPVLVLEKASRLLAGRRVVCDLDLALAKGEVLGLLGVNGAGKSTTLRMIAGVLAPSAGRVRLDG